LALSAGLVELRLINHHSGLVFAILGQHFKKHAAVLEIPLHKSVAYTRVLVLLLNLTVRIEFV